MPHLAFDYSVGLEAKADIGRFCVVMRDAMVECGIFPLGGIRVRGHRVVHAVIADGGDEDYDFLDMILRIGMGRSDEEKVAALDALYCAAEHELRDQLGDAPFALSLQLQEIDPALSRKSYNSIHAALKVSLG